MVMTDSQKWLLLAGAVGGGLLVYLLAPVLTPFAAGALLAYMGDPLVDRMQAWRLPRTLAVTLVFVTLALLLLALAFILLPLLERELLALFDRIPSYIDWLERNLLPRLSAILGVEAGRTALESLRQGALAHWKEAGGLIARMLAGVSRSGFSLLAWLANLVLIPVVTFYLLRDWDLLVARMRALLPRSTEPAVVEIARECDRVVAEFLRGQLLVMAALGAFYTLGLSLVGLDLAVLIGMSAGLVSFVPYLGPLFGISLAGAAAFFQFHEGWPVLWVAVVFGAGQLLEGMVLTPLLVGERVGLHPVVVIFAVLAAGRLFGFLGVLLAVPAAAVILVVLRYVYRRYVQSEFYRS